MIAIGQQVYRKEAWNKVSGAAKYNDDFTAPGLLHATLVVSPYAHARLFSVDSKDALKIDGVLAVVTGQDTAIFCGEVLEDRPPLARGKVRYFGEPVAIVVAYGEAQAMRGAAAVKVQYEPLPVVNSPSAALAPGAPLVHEALGNYVVAQPPVYPEPGSNVADRAKVRKGDVQRGFAQSDVVIETRVTLPQVDHAAMETRSVRAEILPDGRIVVNSGSQAPFEIQALLSQYFQVELGNVIVNTPLIGGAFGGKAAVQLEPLAYLASKAVGGRLVKLTNPREQDLASSPVGMGLEAHVKLAATRTGRITTAEMTFLIDTGAYTDSSPRVARAIAGECTGPYNIENVSCDTLCVYTNHTYTTAFRGFGHMPFTFAIERAVDKLAEVLGIDAVTIRRQNCITPGDTTPTRVKLTRSNLGDLPQCLEKTARLIGWHDGARIDLGGGKVRAKGIACFWKTSSSDPNAISGVILTLNKDGSINLSAGTVEFGPGTKTTAAQILAEALRMDIDKIHVHMEVNTKVDPVHWKTVASVSTYMVGRAVLEAAEDIGRQLKGIAAIVLRCPPGDLEIGGSTVYLRDDPTIYVSFKDIAHGYTYPGGDAIGGQIIGRGSFIMRHLKPLNRETGEGRPGPAWTVGAQAVEVEYDEHTCTYRIVRVASVIDAGIVVNPKGARGAVMGGICMGLGYGSREGVLYSKQCEMLNNQLRTYKVMRYGEQPEYLVEFVETPQADAPFGARPIGEHGILAIPAALAGALGRAAGLELDTLPLTPERIWSERRSRVRDCVRL